MVLCINYCFFSLFLVLYNNFFFFYFFIFYMQIVNVFYLWVTIYIIVIFNSSFWGFLYLYSYLEFYILYVY